MPAPSTPSSYLKERHPLNTLQRSAQNMPPSPVPFEQAIGGAKTPFPDLTVGLLDRVVASKLESMGVRFSNKLLRDLQFQGVLVSCPTQLCLGLRFPSLVVEGKSYVTGRSLYEAQNQAAVSGSMMLLTQHRLSELARSGSLHPPLAFSICSEGPVWELWVHYSTSDAGERHYKSRSLQIGHASLFNTMVEFLWAVFRVLRWTRSDFLNDVAEKLLNVWNGLSSRC